jgi:Cys-tRNA(Pro) deacylase
MPDTPLLQPPTDLPPVALALAALGIPHTIFRHPGPVHSLEQAAAERGQTPAQVVRSILFRLGRSQAGDGSGDFAMVLMAGPGQIAWKALRQHFGQSRLTMATPDEVLTVTGYPVGAVAPFGMPNQVPVLVDESVTAQTEISLGSGQRGTTIILTVADLLAALGAVTVGKFGEEVTSDV